MAIYDKNRIRCRTFIESLNSLFCMGKELENRVNSVRPIGVTVKTTDFGITITYDNTGIITITDNETYYTINY